MLKIKPPTHAADGLAVFISQTDPAWDRERIIAERQAFIASALERKRDAAPMSGDPERTAAERDAITLTHEETVAAVALAPVERYYNAKTRYQPDAPDTAADGSPTTARAYMKPGQRPTEFGLRRLGFMAFQAVNEIASPRASLIEAARLGLRSIVADGHRWQSVSDAPAPSEQLEALHAADPSLLTEIGEAVLKLNRPLDPEAEVPR